MQPGGSRTHDPLHGSSVLYQLDQWDNTTGTLDCTTSNSACSVWGTGQRHWDVSRHQGQYCQCRWSHTICVQFIVLGPIQCLGYPTLQNDLWTRALSISSKRWQFSWWLSSMMVTSSYHLAATLVSRRSSTLSTGSVGEPSSGSWWPHVTVAARITAVSTLWYDTPLQHVQTIH